MARIGPHLAEELQLAGLAGLPFTWGEDGVDLTDPRLTSGQIAAIQAVVAAHDPLVPATPSPMVQAKVQFATFRFPDPAQIDAAIDAAANLADLKAILRRLAKAVLYLARATGVDT
jgi:hypothetical protein